MSVELVDVYDKKTGAKGGKLPTTALRFFPDFTTTPVQKSRDAAKPKES